MDVMQHDTWVSNLRLTIPRELNAQSKSENILESLGQIGVAGINILKIEQVCRTERSFEWYSSRVSLVLKYYSDMMSHPGSKSKRANVPSKLVQGLGNCRCA